MNPERRIRERRALTLFNGAVELAGAERAAFLEQACGRDAELRARVEALLARDAAAQPRLDEAILGPGFRVNAFVEGSSESPDEADVIPLPASIGPYRIHGLVGEGGMGRVYLAEQDRPHRFVALKVVRAGLESDAARRQFEREVEALGRLSHPLIARIFDAGFESTPEGPRPYFAMELIDGVELLEFVADRELDLPSRLRLVIDIADAVEHAHRRDVIHRDLKPANILVDRRGQPRILDFGIARTDDPGQGSQVTDELGHLRGTPAYMSPERVSGSGRDVDHRTDIYSLGVVAYELLAGRSPFDLAGRSPFDTLRIVSESDPVPLGRIDRRLRGDLETIAAKAMEKEPARRYASMEAFAADLKRYLNHDPIAARPPTRAYRFTKFVRKYRTAVAGVAASFALLIAAVIGTGVGMFRAWDAEVVALARADDVESALQFLDDVFLQIASVQRADQPITFEQVLDEAVRKLDGASSSPGRAVVFERNRGLEARVRNSIGQAYLQYGLYAKSVEQLRRALATRCEVLGVDAPDTVDTRENLAVALREAGQLVEALALVEATRAVHRDRFGLTAETTLRSDLNYAQTLEAIGRRKEARDQFMELVARSSTARGATNPLTLTIRESLAKVYHDLGDYTAACAEMEEVVELTRQTSGDYALTTLFAIDSLAVCLVACDRLKDADRLRVGLAERLARALDPRNPRVLVARSNLALLRAAQKLWPEAESIQRDVIEIEKRVLGPVHPQTLVAQGNYADIQVGLGRTDVAESLWLRLLEDWRSLGEVGAGEVAVVADDLARLFARKRDATPAERRLRELLKPTLLQPPAAAPGDADLLADLDAAGERAANDGDLDRADLLLRQSLEIRRRIGCDRDLAGVENLLLLAEVVAESDRRFEVERLANEALARLPECSNATPERIAELSERAHALLAVTH